MAERPRIEPRGLTADQAADYLSLSPQGFRHWVSRGILPGAIPGTHRWDRKAIDMALDKASGIETTRPSALAAWKAGRDARAA